MKRSVSNGLKLRLLGPKNRKGFAGAMTMAIVISIMLLSLAQFALVQRQLSCDRFFPQERSRLQTRSNLPPYLLNRDFQGEEQLKWEEGTIIVRQQTTVFTFCSLTTLSWHPDQDKTGLAEENRLLQVRYGEIKFLLR